MGGTEATLNYIVKRFNIDLNQLSPIMIPNTDRVTLAKLFGELRFRSGAEIGVAEGHYSRVLCDNNHRLKLHCIDSWVKYPGYIDFVTPSVYSTFEEHARESLASYNCTLIKKYSLDAVGDFADRSLDFVYIDANHDVRHVIDDITEWSVKIRRGGIIAGHDYAMPRGRRSRCHVVYAVNAYTTAWHINPWFVFGREERLPDERRESERSWMYVI